jgi:hypothetical protein
MKHSKFVIGMELATLAYMALMVWILFPQFHAPIAKGWHGTVYRWRLGRDQVRFTPLPLWVQEAAQVRGRFQPTTRAPRPLNLPL